MSSGSNWTSITESRFPWERKALQFIRDGFPPYDTYWAWSNFEFIADDGSINEVDLLVFTPHGFFLVEIKSQPGQLSGDVGTWNWEHDGRNKTVDNPLILANKKSKKLKSLLQKQSAFRKAGADSFPYLEPLIFCSAPALKLELTDRAAFRVCVRDREGSADASYPGILKALRRRECPGLDLRARGTHDRPTLKMIKQALEQAGVRPSRGMNKVSDYELERLLGEGPNFQDWLGRHAAIPKTKRRIRIYLVRQGATSDERKMIERAAAREFQLLEHVDHPSVLKAHGFSECELGHAIIFEHDPDAVRLDHYLAQRRGALPLETQLELVRQIAEVVRFAHEKHIVHRGLSPQSVLVVNPDGMRPRIKVFNWQSGYLEASESSGTSNKITATCHVGQLVDDASTAYIAPEVLSDPSSTGEQLDIFSLGAIAYHIFSGQFPAANGLELSETLRESSGLKISSVLNGAAEALQELVAWSTHPVRHQRHIETAVDFLEKLGELEEELTTPEHEFNEDPTSVQIEDTLPGGYVVKKRLGQGGTSLALLVEKGGEEFVLKAANDLAHNDRIKGEGEVLSKLRHAHIVEYLQTITIGDRACLLMKQAGTETLGQRLRKEGRLHIDLLQRFGEDLLSVVNFLEEQGIAHRDIKPDNIGVGKVGRGSKLHLILFDFSLSRAAAENIRAGTPGYLDPLLPLRKRWDLHAERYAAAATLYELTTGVLPKWGDGTSDPSHLECEITVDGEAFEPALRDGFVEFFEKAFRRDASERYDNAEQMLGAWRHCFADIEESEVPTDHESEEELRELLAGATLDTAIIELGLGTRARNALDQKNILKVSDLLKYPIKLLIKQRGVGNKTKREIAATARILREKLGAAGQMPTSSFDAAVSPGTSLTEEGSPEQMSVDQLAARLLKTSSRSAPAEQNCLQALLGFDETFKEPWPAQTELANHLGVSRQRVGQIVETFQERWKKVSGLTALRSDIVAILARQGGVMALPELREAVLTARGSIEDEPRRSQISNAILRAAVEVERTLESARFFQRRAGSAVLIAVTQDLAALAVELGHTADKIAKEDPLLSPTRALEKLREVQAPEGVSISDLRLLRIATAVSASGALSSKLEIYPRGMAAERALRLAQGAILTIPKKGKDFTEITIRQIRERVESRYPLAAQLPERPELDALIGSLDFDLVYLEDAAQGEGAYVTRSNSISSGTRSQTRLNTYSGGFEPEEITPEIADARQFEERLTRAHRDGAFLCMIVGLRHYESAALEISDRFAVETINVESVLLTALRAAADEANVNWDLVLQADATPGQGDWDKLLLLVKRALPAVEARITAATKTVLLVYAGVLARYEQMGMLERLRENIGRPGGVPGIWLLVPGDGHALLDGKAVPLIGPGQRVRIPGPWLRNAHRSSGKSNGEIGRQRT